MSEDTEDTSEKKGKGRKGDPDEGRPLNEPVPKDLKMFEWLENLFSDSNDCPELIDCRIVFGTRKEKLGPCLDRVPFAPSSASDEAVKKMPGRSKRPSREQLVQITNRWLHRMQQDCDNTRQAQCYALHAWHFSTDDQPYSRYVKACKPSGRFDAENAPATLDDEQAALDQRHSVQVLEHHQKMFDMYASALQGVCQLLSERVDQDAAERKELHATIARQNEMMERALSLEADREERREWAKTKREAAQRGLDLAFQVVPPLLSSISKGKIGPGGGPALEAIALQNFMKMPSEGGSFTEEQASRLFGVWKDEQVITPGILNKEQAAVILGVAFHNQPVEQLDLIVPGSGSALELQPDQIAALQQVFSMDQLAPILILFQSRAKKK